MVTEFSLPCYTSGCGKLQEEVRLPEEKLRSQRDEDITWEEAEELEEDRAGLRQRVHPSGYRMNQSNVKSSSTLSAWIVESTTHNCVRLLISNKPTGALWLWLLSLHSWSSHLLQDNICCDKLNYYSCFL